MKKHLAIGHRSSYLIQQCSISLNLLSKKERRALKFKIDFNMDSECFINSHVVSNSIFKSRSTWFLPIVL